MIHILLAAYNEEAALGEVLNGIARTLADGDYKVWVVNDGSSDGTAAVVADWRRKIPLIPLVHPVNRGLGAALQTGLEALKGQMRERDVLVTLDADNTHPPALIPRLAAPVENGTADIVIASRFVRGAVVAGVPFFRRLTGRAASWLFRLAIPLRGVRDYTCGFRAYGGALLLKGFAAPGRMITENGFACQAEWIIKLGRWSPRVVEIPLLLRYDRKPTASKMPVLRTIGSTLDLLRRLRKLK